MKAIIFGITGQDGSYLAELLLEKGYEVIGVTRRVSVDTLQRVDHILPQITIIEGDITDAFSVANIIKEHCPDEIFNLAAQSHVGTSFSQPSLTWDVTAGGCLNILEAIRYSEFKDRIRFYQASSSEMFGKNFSELGDMEVYRNLSVDNVCVGIDAAKAASRYQNEDTPFAPQSPYAIAKLAAHHLVQNYRTSYGIFACSGILFNHESERRGEKFVTRKITKWIGKFINWRDKRAFIQKVIQEESKEGVFPQLRLGNLDSQRDWGHAEDYVRAMWLMLQQEEPDDYVVATGETHSVRDFLDVAFNCVDIDDWSPYVGIDPKFYRPAEVDYLLGCPKKAQSTLKWSPETSFQELVQRMVEHDIHEAKLRRSSLQAI